MSTTATKEGDASPKMLSDPRFLAARRMMQTGRVADGAVDMFATLVEEAIAKYTDTSLEAAVCFYEYGNALFRNHQNASIEEEEKEEKEAAALITPAEDPKSAAAAAAEARLAQGCGDSKPAAKEDSAVNKSVKEEEAKPVKEEDAFPTEKTSKNDKLKPATTDDDTSAVEKSSKKEEMKPVKEEDASTTEKSTQEGETKPAAKEDNASPTEKSSKDDDLKLAAKEKDTSVAEQSPKEKGEKTEATSEEPSSSEAVAEKVEVIDVDAEYAENHKNDDIELALELMENAYSILEEKASSSGGRHNEWMQRQMPRVLQGIGDVLQELKRTADAADAYSRALPYREEFVQAFVQKKKDKDDSTYNTLQHLKDRRLLVEANVLVAEALLGCAHGHHVVTSETKDMLVTADERVDYARGYYDKARDELQETVFLLGTMASAGEVTNLGDEKENVCLAATLLMGVGETLAAFDEKMNDNNKRDGDVVLVAGQPVVKKPKLT